MKADQALTHDLNCACLQVWRPAQQQRPLQAGWQQALCLAPPAPLVSEKGTGRMRRMRRGLPTFSVQQLAWLCDDSKVGAAVLDFITTHHVL